LKEWPIRFDVIFDSLNYGVKGYHLVTDAPAAFRLDVYDTSGTLQIFLVLTQPLDYEKRSQYNMQVIAVDGGRPERTGTITIDVIVSDANDNIPIFTQSVYNITIPEDAPVGTTVVTVLAIDADSGQNGKVCYVFSSQTSSVYSDMFAIDAKTGVLSLLRALDYVESTTHRLFVVAEDPGNNSLPPVALVIINVIDINNNAPLITIDAIRDDHDRILLSENLAVNLWVAGVSVDDLDTGVNGLVNCSIIAGGNDFSLTALYEGEFQLLAARSFDYEIEQSVIATIKCYDHGIPSLSAIRTINVTITNSKDNNVLAFEKSLYEVWLQENYDVHEYIFNVTALGLRDTNKSNAVLIYSLDPGETRFNIDSSSGAIRALVSFDPGTFRNHPIMFDVIVTLNDTRNISVRAVVHLFITGNNSTKFKTSVNQHSVTVMSETGSELESSLPINQTSEVSTAVVSIVAGFLVILVIVVCVVLLVMCQNLCLPKRRRPAVKEDRYEDTDERLNTSASNTDQTESVLVVAPPEYSDILTLDAEPVNYSARHRWQLTCQNDVTGGKRDVATRIERDADSICTEMTTSGTSCGSILHEDFADAMILRTSISSNYNNAAYMYNPGRTWPRRSQCLDSPSDEFPPPPSPLCQPRYTARISDHTAIDLPAPFFNNYAYECRPVKSAQFERTTTFGIRLPSFDIPPRPAAAMCRVPRTYSTNGSLSSLADKPLVQLGIIPPPMSLQRAIQMTGVTCNGNGGGGMVRSASNNGSRKSVRFADNAGEC